MKKLSHANILHLYDVIDSPKQLYLIMEFAQGKSLTQYLKTPHIESRQVQSPEFRQQALPEHQASQIMSHLLQACSYMHSRQVCHRDLKGCNIIYQPETSQVKIIDFGFAISCEKPLKVFCGTPSYMSPEIVNKSEYDGAAADCWALGVIMHNLCTGQVPFKHKDEKGLFAKIRKGQYAMPVNQRGEPLSAECRDLLKSLLDPDQASRITADTALHHPWVSRI